MIRVFVSGCYDILHAGHVQFFREARALGDHLTVADFAVSVALPHAEKIRLPLDGFKNIARWQSHLEELPGWREPFPQVKAAA